jgi:hypothetical protein
MAASLETLTTLYAALLRAEATWIETHTGQDEWQLRLCIRRLQKFFEAGDAERQGHNDIA